ncbi:MAG: DUF58 domain-containing protein [Prochlorococcus sp.]|nr:DUF58 domain-containing protein [Prochlorococcus sp.]
MIHGLRNRLKQRLSREGTPLTLSMRKLYILPSRFGGLWLIGSAVLYIIGINSNSNGPILLAFLCSGLFLISLFLTQFNLQGLELAIAEPGPGFAGDLVPYPIRLQSHQDRYRLRLAFSHQPLLIQPVVPSGISLAHPCWCPTKRGLQTPGRLKVYSKAPLGLFVCWSYWLPPQQQLIYPKALSGPVLEQWRPLQQDHPIKNDANQANGTDDFNELSPHRPEEGLQRVAWKQLAGGHGWLTKRFSGEAASQLVLKLDSKLPLEKALEHLSARVMELSQQDEPFALELPGRQVVHGRGRHHRDAALQALALA